MIRKRAKTHQHNSLHHDGRGKSIHGKTTRRHGRPQNRNHTLLRLRRRLVAAPHTRLAPIRKEEAIFARKLLENNGEKRSCHTR
jgi:hypothetical protein